MNIEIPTEFLETLKLISARSGETTEEAINSSIRFFIMIHCIPADDQVELKTIVSRTFPDIKLKGLH